MKLNNKKELQKAKKAYKKILNTLNKNVFCKENFLTYFITYLRYLRDVAILSTKIVDWHNDFLATTLFMAIKEFDAYETCATKYFDKIGEVLDKSIDREIVVQKYAEEKQEHLFKFYSIVSENLQSWIEIYGN